MNAPPDGAQRPAFTVPGGAAHLDQLIRQTRVHHMQLSMIADQKAAMLLTVSSVLLTLSAQNLDEPRFRWAAALLIGFSALTVCFAALAAMPKLGKARVPSRNILFFGTFTHLRYEQFLAEMEQVMASAATTYEAQLREVYELGQYLERQKYRYVRYGYLSFLAGLVASAIAWVAMAFW